MTFTNPVVTERIVDMQIKRFNLQVFLALTLSAAAMRGQILPPGPPIVVPKPSPAAVPPTTAAAATAAPQAAVFKTNAPRAMKLLVIAGDGTEPAYAAIKASLDTLGIPYDTAVTVKLSATGTPTLVPLPPLTDAAATKGNYQGIVLSSGNPVYCALNVCTPGLGAADWTVLENYAHDFGVRIASYYSWPEARYGLAFNQALSSTTTPKTAYFTGDAASLFPYLNTAAGVSIANAYMYLATAAPITGETTTPFLTVNGYVVGATHRKADGREYLALTVDSSPYLTHTLQLSYGVLNWVTKGVFLGGRKVYLTPQVDDVFLSNDQYKQGVAACTPVGFVNDPTYDPSGACPTLRITGADLQNLANWQAKWNQNAQFKAFKVAHAYNGLGAADATGAVLKNDSLVTAAIKLKNSFWWLTHTWDHEDLDCFNPAPNSGAASCVPATYAQSITELSKNFAIGGKLGLPVDAPSIVTPGISGLKNPDFLRAAVAQGIRYLVSDTSKPEYLPAIPNTGIRNPLQPSILMIPRRPTNIFYNTMSGFANVPGSLPDEYNHFFGPSGIFRIGGPGGPPFFPTVQSYADIVNRESDNLLGYMLRNEIYPQMYHQGNVYRFSGNATLLTDAHDAAFRKFAAISNLPVISLQQTDIGKEIERRMGVIASGVSGVLTPGVSIALTASSGAANAQVTGACGGSSCESYGRQCQSRIAVTVGLTTTVALNGGGTACSANPGGTTVTPTPGGTTPPTGGTTATPQAQLQSTANAISTALAASSDKDVTKYLGEAQKFINESLNPAFWSNGVPVDKKVFEAQEKAAKSLEDALKVKTINQATTMTVLWLLDSITATDFTLVTNAVQAATKSGGASKELDKAGEELDKASDYRNQGKYHEAIDHLGKAWEAVQQATK